MKKELLDWADKYLPQFNEFSLKYNASYYTQSPLSKVDSNIELMIFGINPKGVFGKDDKVAPQGSMEYLDGNKEWEGRFLPDGKIHKDWGRFLGGAHHFLGFSNSSRVDDYIDDDTKTVWTNFCPFPSQNGFTGVPKEIIDVSIQSAFDLIEILKPKRIVILGTKGIEQLYKCTDKDSRSKIQYRKVIDNQSLYIGRICDIPTVCVSHPSSWTWAVSNMFITVFTYLYFFVDKKENGKFSHSLDEVRDLLRHEFKQWVDKIKIE